MLGVVIPDEEVGAVWAGTEATATSETARVTFVTLNMLGIRACSEKCTGSPMEFCTGTERSRKCTEAMRRAYRGEEHTWPWLAPAAASSPALDPDIVRAVQEMSLSAVVNDARFLELCGSDRYEQPLGVGGPWGLCRYQTREDFDLAFAHLHGRACCAHASLLAKKPRGIHLALSSLTGHEYAGAESVYCAMSTAQILFAAAQAFVVERAFSHEDIEQEYNSRLEGFAFRSADICTQLARASQHAHVICLQEASPDMLERVAGELPGYRVVSTGGTTALLVNVVTVACVSTPAPVHICSPGAGFGAGSGAGSGADSGAASGAGWKQLDVGRNFTVDIRCRVARDERVADTYVRVFAVHLPSDGSETANAVGSIFGPTVLRGTCPSSPNTLNPPDMPNSPATPNSLSLLSDAGLPVPLPESISEPRFAVVMVGDFNNKNTAELRCMCEQLSVDTHPPLHRTTTNKERSVTVQNTKLLHPAGGIWTDGVAVLRRDVQGTSQRFTDKLLADDCESYVTPAVGSPSDHVLVKTCLHFWASFTSSEITCPE